MVCSLKGTRHSDLVTPQEKNSDDVWREDQGLSLRQGILRRGKRGSACEPGSLRGGFSRPRDPPSHIDPPQEKSPGDEGHPLCGGGGGGDCSIFLGRTQNQT